MTDSHTLVVVKSLPLLKIKVFQYFRILWKSENMTHPDGLRWSNILYCIHWLAPTLFFCFWRHWCSNFFTRCRMRSKSRNKDVKCVKELKPKMMILCWGQLKHYYLAFQTFWEIIKTLNKISLILICKNCFQIFTQYWVTQIKFQEKLSSVYSLQWVKYSMPHLVSTPVFLCWWKFWKS